MISYKQRRFVFFYALLDLSVVGLAFLASAVISTDLASESFRARGFLWPARQLMAVQSVVCFLWYLCFRSLGLYLSQRLERGSGEWRNLLKGCLVGVSLSALAASLFRLHLPPEFYLLFWALSASGLIATRRAARAGLRWARSRGRNIRHVVIIGSGRKAVRLLRRLARRPELGYRIEGYVDDRALDASGGRSPLRKYRYLGTVAEFVERMPEIVVDEVFVALPIKSRYDDIRRILLACEEQGVLVRIPSDLFDLRIARATTTELDGLPILTLFTGSPRRWKWELAKRALDVVAATVAIVVLSPIMICAAILVKLSSPGPVLFKQKRVGYNKRIFEMYKFRTMVVGAENMMDELEAQNEADGPVFKMRNDPRVTKVGRWLRKFSIDELPQLFNVLKGDMSLVGPRPLPLRDVSRFHTNWPRRRFSVRPGLTCFWQVSGRSTIGFDEWMRMDLEYIDTWSLKLDLKLLLRTIPSVVRGTGAY